MGIGGLGTSYLDLTASTNYKRVPVLSVDDAWVPRIDKERCVGKKDKKLADGQIREVVEYTLIIYLFIFMNKYTLYKLLNIR